MRDVADEFISTNELLGMIYVDLLGYLEAIRKKDYTTASVKAAAISESTIELALKKGG